VVWRNAKATVLIGGNPETDEAGYMIQGDIQVMEDPGLVLRGKLHKRYASDADQSTWQEGDTVCLRLEPRKVIRVY
jgi:hypothetical protein